MLGFALLGILVVALIFCGALEFIHSARARSRPSSPAPSPPSSVRVLRSEAEIIEAVDRAIEFERRAADVLERRIAGYHAARPAAELIPLESNGAGGKTRLNGSQRPDPASEQASA